MCVRVLACVPAMCPNWPINYAQYIWSDEHIRPPEHTLLASLYYAEVRKNQHTTTLHSHTRIPQHKLLCNRINLINWNVYGITIHTRHRQAQCERYKFGACENIMFAPNPHLPLCALCRRQTTLHSGTFAIWLFKCVRVCAQSVCVAGSPRMLGELEHHIYSTNICTATNVAGGTLLLRESVVVCVDLCPCKRIEPQRFINGALNVRLRAHYSVVNM